MGLGRSSQFFMQTFICDSCSQLLFFENLVCIRCRHALGYSAPDGAILTLEPLRQDDQGRQVYREITESDEEPGYRYCANTARYNACNWLVPADSEEALCRSCLLTEVLPPLTDEKRRLRWIRVEAAKRRLLFSLLGLGLPVVGRIKDPELGLSFRFEESTPEKPVMTGHANGVITMNMAEANASFRENAKEKLGEAYRTVLGHLRHECGHYYWERLVRMDGEMVDRARELFGDERSSYQEAIDRHYESGPPAGWHSEYISAYATMHPWEDWAETWAHYLHMVDTLETASSYEVAVKSPRQLSGQRRRRPAGRDLDGFEKIFHRWYSLTFALNGLNRSMGLADLYPFTISDRVKEKLRLVHQVVSLESESGPD